MLDAPIDEGVVALARERARNGAATREDHHLLAQADYRQGALEDALVHARRARAEGPPGGAAAFLEGLIHREAGRLAEAAAAFDAAARESDRDALRGRALSGLGTVLCLQGDPQGALAPLRRGVDLRPDLAEAWHNLGVAAVRARSWPDAERAFQWLARTATVGRDAYFALLVDVGRASGLDEMRTQGHRIKNLISLLGDQARQLARELEATGLEQGERASRLARSTAEVFTAMQRYLGAMREEPLQLDLIDPNDLVARCLFAASSSTEGLHVEKRLAPDLEDVLGDPSELEEVVMNVLLNAADAVREGPRRPVEAPDILVVTRRDPGGRVVIDVEDRGPGVAPDQREHVFLLGYTTKPRGSGIGLTQVRRTVRAHGGDVVCDAAHHGGARFSIVLPVRPPGEARLALLALRSPLFETLQDLELREPRP